MRGYISFLFLLILLSVMLFSLKIIQSTPNSNSLLNQEKVFYSNIHAKEVVRERVAFGAIGGALAYIALTFPEGITLSPDVLKDIETASKVGAVVMLKQVQYIQSPGSPVSSITFCSYVPNVFDEDLQSTLVSMAKSGEPETLPYTFGVSSFDLDCLDAIDVDILPPPNVTDITPGSAEDVFINEGNATLFTVRIGGYKEGMPFTIGISTASKGYATYSYIPIGYDAVDISISPDVIYMARDIILEDESFIDMIQELNLSANST